MNSVQKTMLLSGQGPCVLSPPVTDPLSHVQSQTERKALLASLRGQKLHIPNLKPLFQHWPSKTNANLERMRQDVREWLKSTIAPGKTLDALLASDFALFGATLWPCAQYDKLRIITYLVVWLFTWDDQFDHNEGTLWEESGNAQICREQTISFIRYTLGIDAERPTVQNQIILNFEPIGLAIQGYYTLEKRHMFLNEVAYYIDMVEREQRLRLSGSIASLEEFWQYRLGTSAVTVCLALNELSWEGMVLPENFYADSDIHELYRHTNTVISAVNDVLSVKKEIKQEAIDSLIPIMFYQSGDIQSAVEQVIIFIKDEIRRVDEITASLTRKYSDSDPSVQEQVHLFIEGCKHHATGTVVWSSETNRYGVNHTENGSGDIIMIL